MTDDVKIIEEPFIDPMQVNLIENPAAPEKGSPKSFSIKDKVSKILSRVKDSDNDAHIEAVPIRVLIGFLPDVSKRDALEFSQGLAEKYFEKITLAYFKVFPMDNGWAYEAHEGGSGRAYLPAILAKFEEHGAFNGRDESSVIIKTATRFVEVTRTKDGLSSIFLPESSHVIPTPGILPSEKMDPAFDRRTGFLIAGSILFVTGCVAFFSSMLIGRYHDHVIEQAPPYIVDYAKLPISKWNDLQVSASKGTVTKFSFNGKTKTWDPIAINEFKKPATSSPETPPTSPATVKDSGSSQSSTNQTSEPISASDKPATSASSFKIPAPRGATTSN